MLRSYRARRRKKHTSVVIVCKSGETLSPQQLEAIPWSYIAEGVKQRRDGSEKIKTQATEAAWKGAHTSLAGLAMSEKAGMDILAVFWSEERKKREEDGKLRAGDEGEEAGAIAVC